VTTPPDITGARRVVVGVDSSGRSAFAAEWAAHEAQDRNVPVLHLVHAIGLPGAAGGRVPPSDDAAAWRAAGVRLLETIGRRVRARYPDLIVTAEVSDHRAVETLVDLSREAELTVTATRGHGGFSGLLLGSVSLKLAAHAHGPAVIVRGDDNPELRNVIILGLEPDQAREPIEFAFASAAAVGASVHAVRGWDPIAGYGIGGAAAPGGGSATEHAAASDMDSLLRQSRAAYPDVPVSFEVIRGNPVPALAGAARGCRLLVIGAHRKRPGLSVGVGYVVHGLLSHAATPVAVVPTS
jgi:nucleotide-binding universal stress UspA family protein